MFTKFAKNSGDMSDLLAQEMSKRLNKEADAFNPVEEEYMEPEKGSNDYSASDTRHFSEEGGRVWGLDLDKEDMHGMHEESVGPREEKLQKLMDGVKDWDDLQLDGIVNMIEALNKEKEEADAFDMPLSASAVNKAEKVEK